MTERESIQISWFQLNLLLDEEQKLGLKSILEHGIYCTVCAGSAENVTVKEIYLTALNDIQIIGNCSNCKGDVTRVMESGENRRFVKRADEFRKSL